MGSLLRAGDPVPSFRAVTTTGQVISHAQLQQRYTLLSFHRYVGCPLCNLTVRRFSSESPRLLREGFQVINVFESSDVNLKEALRAWGDVDYPIVADPTAGLFATFRVENSLLGALRTLGQPRALLESLKTPGPKIARDGSSLRMPASFLIGPTLRLLDVHYGLHPADAVTHENIERWLRLVVSDRAEA